MSLNGRIDERLPVDATIMFNCSADQPYCFYGATIVNYSQGGVFFQSKYALEPGAIVSFNGASYSQADYSADTYRPHRIQVKWCREMSDDGGQGYGIGAQFLDPLTTFHRDSLAPEEPARSQSEKEKQAASDSVEVPVTSEADLESSGEKLKSAMNVARSRANKLEVLNRFAASVSSTLDLNEILQSVCKEMTRLFGARNTGIGLLDKMRTKLTLVAFYSDDPNESDATGLDMPVEGNAATHRVVETGQSIVVPDVMNNPLTQSIHTIARKRGTECLMIVPLLSRGEVIGTIGMPTSDKNRVFTTEEVSLAQTIASQIASAIENARLFEETERAKKRAEHDLEIGRKIQTDFFPEKLPAIEGWEVAAHFEPAREVSGDFYDFFLVGYGQCLGLVMGDVCDHGVGSALFMVLFRSLIRAYAEPSFKNCEAGGKDDPVIVKDALLQSIQMTNQYIATTHERSGMFATLFFGVLDPDTGMLTYINCGHESPLILGGQANTRQLKPTGPAMGLNADSAYGVAQVQLSAGQMLFLYTDGTTDAQNPDGEYFSKKRLLDILDASSDTALKLIDDIKSCLTDHIAGTDLYDDVTLLAVKRNALDGSGSA